MLRQRRRAQAVGPSLILGTPRLGARRRLRRARARRRRAHRGGVGRISPALGDWRLTLTSPYRPLCVLWRSAVATPHRPSPGTQSMSGHLWSWSGRWTGSTPFVTAATVALATRPVVFLVGYLAVFMFGYAPAREPFHEFDSELLNLPLRWDAGWYLQIAKERLRIRRHAAGAARPAEHRVLPRVSAHWSAAWRCCSATTMPRTCSARTATSLRAVRARRSRTSISSRASS